MEGPAALAAAACALALPCALQLDGDGLAGSSVVFQSRTAGAAEDI